MTERTGHSKNCEQAEKPPCACKCGGAEHAWQEALSIAAAPSTDDLNRLRNEADEAWLQATRPRAGQRKPGPQTSDGQHAAIRSFIADVVRWLRRDRSLHHDTRQLGEPFRISRDTDPEHPRRRLTSGEQREFIEKHVIPQLCEEFDEGRINAFQKQASKAHFWCELLAQIAHALYLYKRQYDKAMGSVIAALTGNGGQLPDSWTALLAEKAVIERAVELVFEQLPRFVTGGVTVDDIFRLIWPARVLAVLMCREPRRHWSVRLYCVQPIVEYGPAKIREEVKDRLRNAFPVDWPPPDSGAPRGLL